MFAVLALSLPFAAGAVAAGAGDAVVTVAGEASVADSGGHVELRVPLARAVPWRLHFLDAPPRLVLDMEGFRWDNPPRIGSDSVMAANAGPYIPGWARLVLVLREPLEVETAEMRGLEDGSAELRIALAPTTAAAFRELADAGAGSPPGPAPAPARGPAPSGRLRVALDAGHGGLDPGAEAGGLRESDVTLAFAEELGRALDQTGRFEAVLTREADVFVPLETRLTLARAAGADVFISLHADALEPDAGPASGMTVYTLADEGADDAARLLAERHARHDILAGVDLKAVEDEIALVLLDLARRETTPRSELLARTIVGAFEARGLKLGSRPHRHGGFSVLKAAEIPSALIELGFLSNDKDRARLSSPEWRAQAASAIAEALRDWEAGDRSLREGLRQ